jgi:hypothetical protein
MAEYHVELAQRALWNLHGPDQTVWVNRLTPELDNVPATLRWARAAGRHDVMLTIAASLWYFLELQWQPHRGGSMAAPGARGES